MAADTLVTGSKLTAIANAIRTKGGTSSPLTLDQMPQAVADLPSGGGGGVNGIAEQTLSKGNLTASDSYVDITGADFGSEGTHKCIRAFAFYADSDAYRTADRLRSVVIPSWITETGDKAFSHSSLEQCTVDGTSVLTLGSHAFSYTKLKAFAPTRPIVLATGGDQFQSCASLKSVDMEICGVNGGTTYVPGRCFSGCSALESLKLRSSSTNISFVVYALSGNDALAEIVLDFGVVPTIQSTSLNRLPSTCSIYVRDALVNDYKVATNWSAVANQIKPMSEYVG